MNPLLFTELAVMEEGREWTRRRLQAQLQRQADQVPLVDVHSGETLRQVRRRPLTLDTVVGRVELEVAYGYARGRGAWVSPVRVAWGLEPGQRISPELQSRLCFNATVAPSYEAAAALAQRWGCPVSDDLVHAQVQRIGERAAVLQPPVAVAPAPEPEFSLVIMMDGWMARERGPDWGAGARKRDAERVVWHEIKSAVIYHLEQRAQTAGGRGLLVEKYVVASPPQTGPVEFGAAVQAEAMRRGLARARKVYVVMDGAVWLWALSEDRFAGAIQILDFHHAREHLMEVAKALYGENTEAARAWVQPLIRDLRRGGETRVIRTLEQLLKPSGDRTREAQEVVEREVEYFRTHADHMHYRRWERQGAPLGSGAVESLGTQLQRRLRTCGQFWERPGLTRLLALVVTFKNRDDTLLWN